MIAEFFLWNYFSSNFNILIKKFILETVVNNFLNEKSSIEKLNIFYMLRGKFENDYQKKLILGRFKKTNDCS